MSGSFFLDLRALLQTLVVRTLAFDIWTWCSIPMISGISNARRMIAINFRLSGERLNGMWKDVQNHHADNSVAFVTPTFSKMFRQWFSTVLSEMKHRAAISHLLAPHANNSAISASRLVSFTSVFILHYAPNFLDSILGECLFNGFCFWNLGFDNALNSV